jgi:hydroxymethylpyrimidine pyrophosphatase-like HAD family hydrolase
MRFHALACDYDGTLASEGRVSRDTVAALERLQTSGRKLILVTGRLLKDLLTVFPQAGICDRIVAENGALLYRPATNEEVVLGTAPPAALVGYLRRRGVTPLSCGRVIVATWEPHQVEALEAIRELNLEVQVIFNKGAVMLLPSGINKATGLKCALAELGLSRHNTVSVGDAENDHALLAVSGCAVAVANAVASLRASNLMLFLRIAEGVGDDVWLYHLDRGDYTKWFRDAIKDETLAAAATEQEHRGDATAVESRAAISNAIRTWYTGPAQGSMADGTPPAKS